MTTNLSAIKAVGRSDVYMKTEVVRRVAMIAILAITVFCFHSVTVIAIGYLISSVMDVVIIIAAAKKLTGISIQKQLSAIWKSLLAGIIMAVVVYFMNMLPLAYIWRLIIQVLTGGAIYIGLSAALKAESFAYLIKMIKHRK